MNPSRVIFINRFFYPDHSATSQMLSDLAFALADPSKRSGAPLEVHVITSRQRYDRADALLPAKETISGVEITRVWTSRFGRKSVVGRAVDYTTFYLSATWALARGAHVGDVIVAKTDPPMLSVIAAPVASFRGARLVNWLQDIFPEVAEASGFARSRAGKVLLRPVRWLRNASLRNAHTNVVLGTEMANVLARFNVSDKKVHIIPNWADGSKIVPVPREQNPLRRSWGLSDKFVVGYSGNFGRVHDIDTIVSAIELTAQFGPVSGRDIAWLFVGGGSLYEALKDRVNSRNWEHVIFKPYQPREQLAESLSVPDVHLASLRPEFEGLVVPSKFYGIMAAGRPCIFVGALSGEIAGVINRTDIGFTVREGDSSALARAVRECAEDLQALEARGQRARATFETEYEFSRALDRWQKVINDAS